MGVSDHICDQPSAAASAATANVVSNDCTNHFDVSSNRQLSQQSLDSHREEYNVVQPNISFGLCTLVQKCTALVDCVSEKTLATGSLAYQKILVLVHKVFPNRGDHNFHPVLEL